MSLSNIPPTPPEDAFLLPVDPRALDDRRGTLPVPSQHELNRLKLLSDQDMLSEQEIEYADPIAVQSNQPLPPGTSPYPLPEGGIDLSDEISPADFITAGD